MSWSQRRSEKKTIGRPKDLRKLRKERRRQRLLEETAEERETRLGKRREENFRVKLTADQIALLKGWPWPVSDNFEKYNIELILCSPLSYSLVLFLVVIVYLTNIKIGTLRVRKDLQFCFKGLLDLQLSF